MVVNQLEIMMQTLITSIFSSVYSVEEGVRLLDIFEPLSAREVTETPSHGISAFVSTNLNDSLLNILGFTYISPTFKMHD